MERNLLERYQKQLANDAEKMEASYDNLSSLLSEAPLDGDGPFSDDLQLLALDILLTQLLGEHPDLRKRIREAIKGAHSASLNYTSVCPTGLQSPAYATQGSPALHPQRPKLRPNLIAYTKDLNLPHVSYTILPRPTIREIEKVRRSAKAADKPEKRPKPTPAAKGTGGKAKGNKGKK